LEHDICAQGIAQVGDEELNLLMLGQRSVAAGEGDETLAEVINGAGASQQR
jgi:hypothetical protein